MILKKLKQLNLVIEFVLQGYLISQSQVETCVSIQDFCIYVRMQLLCNSQSSHRLPNTNGEIIKRSCIVKPSVSMALNYKYQRVIKSAIPFTAHLPNASQYLVKKIYMYLKCTKCHKEQQVCGHADWLWTCASHMSLTTNDLM